MAIKATYTQGETIQPTATQADASAVVFRFWPAAKASLAETAAALLASQKQSITVGEISMSDKSADEISKLAGLANSETAREGGAIPMSHDPSAQASWSAAVDSSTLYGAYGYAILATVGGIVSSLESGSFSVSGDPSAASLGGGLTSIRTRFI